MQCVILNCCVPLCVCVLLAPCRKVSLEGVPEDPLWPSADQLLQLLATRLGAAVHTKVIEQCDTQWRTTCYCLSADPAATYRFCRSQP